MKLWAIPSFRLRPSPHWQAVGWISTLFFLGACVTQGTYQEAREERDRLRGENAQLSETVERLEASSVSLDAERAALISQNEDLSQAQVEGQRCAREREEVSSLLKRREEELSVSQEEIVKLRETYQGLVGDLEAEVAKGNMRIQELKEGLYLQLPGEVLFAAGSAQLSDEGRRILKDVANRLRDMPHRVEVRGHTDDRPLAASAVFSSNWSLAAVRAAGVVEILAKEGVDPTRLSAISFGAQQPLVSNETPEGRAENRRIEIRLVPAVDAGGESVAAPPTPPSS